MQQNPQKLLQGMFQMQMKKPLPVIEQGNGFVKLSSKVIMRVGERDENPLLAAEDKRVMSINYQINKLIKRYEHSLFVEYFDHLQDQLILNFPGVTLALGDAPNTLEMSLYNTKQRVVFQITNTGGAG